MRCVKCGKEVDTNVKYCSYCGNKILKNELTIRRKERDMAMKYKMKVVIDGVTTYNLAPSDSEHIPLEDGKHTVQVALNFKKKVIEIEFPKDDILIISFGNQGVEVENPNDKNIGKDIEPEKANEPIGEERILQSEKIVLQEENNTVHNIKEVPDKEEQRVINQTSSKSGFGKILFMGIVVSLLIFVASRLATGFLGKDAECKEAEKYVKEAVYRNYGEIPELESYCLYDGGNVVVIVVKYKLPKLGFDGSYAVRVSDKSQLVSGMTDEMLYDYNYEERLEELKTIFYLD